MHVIINHHAHKKSVMAIYISLHLHNWNIIHFIFILPSNIAVTLPFLVFQNVSLIIHQLPQGLFHTFC
jgi:hypothetical protein